jgi:hypothetical protein
MYEKEKIIREQRIIEATRKGLMGLDGKLGCILRYLGKPIMTEGGGLFESNEGESFHDHLFEDDEEKSDGEWIEGGDNEVDDAGWRGTSQEFAGIKKAYDDDGGSQIGWHFDGLSRGMHLEIKYIEHDLTVTWQGHQVYQENSGQLEMYVPRPEWEHCINKLYPVAKKLENEARKFENEYVKVESQKRKLGFLDTLRRLWGI